LEEIERKRKRDEKKGRGRGRGRGKGKGRGKGASNRTTAEDELPVVGRPNETNSQDKGPHAKKNLANMFDNLLPPSSDESDGEDAHAVALAVALGVQKKAATNIWSDESDFDDENGLSSYREELGVGESDDDVFVAKPTGTRSRPLSAPLPVSTKAGPSRIKEQWMTTVSRQSSSHSQDSDDMFEVTDDGDAPTSVDDDGDAPIPVDDYDSTHDDDDSIHVDEDGVFFKPNVTYVIVEYDEQKFPGIFQKMVEGKYQVSCMRPRGGGKYWIFDEDKPDVYLYYRSEIIEIIKPPTLYNNRNWMFVEGADKYWNKA
jgi:hypothetical protein